MPENASGGISSSSSLLIRSENPRRRQAENPLMPLSEFARPALRKRKVFLLFGVRGRSAAYVGIQENCWYVRWYPRLHQQDRYQHACSPNSPPARSSPPTDSSNSPMAAVSSFGYSQTAPSAGA